MKILAIVLVSATAFTVFSCGGSKASQELEALKTYISRAKDAQAADTLITLLRENQMGELAPEWASLLASVYESKMKDTTSSLSVYQAIVMAFGGTDAAAAAASRIPKGTDALRERIDALQSKVFDPTKLVADLGMIGSYLNSCMAYALLLPKDTQSAVLLNKAAENAYYTQQYDRALYLYEWFETAYPDDSKAAQALFMRAFIYDNDLQQFEVAGPLYQQFLQKYPKDDFADDAEVLLENLGKSPEEMIQYLEGKEVK